MKRNVFLQCLVCLSWTLLCCGLAWGQETPEAKKSDAAESIEVWSGGVAGRHDCQHQPGFGRCDIEAEETGARQVFDSVEAAIVLG